MYTSPVAFLPEKFIFDVCTLMIKSSRVFHKCRISPQSQVEHEAELNQILQIPITWNMEEMEMQWVQPPPTCSHVMSRVFVVCVHLVVYLCKL